MRIALIGPTHPYRGGVSQHTTLLCRHLRRSHEVDFISFRRQYPQWLFPGKTDKDPSRSPDIEPCARLLDAADPSTWEPAARRAAGFRPDALVLVWWVPFFAPAWWFIVRKVRARLRVPVIFICHNVLPHETNAWMARIVRSALGLADGFVVHSEADRGRLLGLRPGAPVIRCPIAPHPSLPPFRGTRRAARAELGIGGRSPVFLFFGFVRPYKGLDLLLDAMTLVTARRPGAALLVVGEFWEPVEKTRRRIRELNLGDSVRIVDRYVGNEEVGVYFAACDAVVLPYRSATQSGVPQMAASLGRPAVVTDVGGLAENVRRTGMGRVVPPGDPAALARAMLSAASGKTTARPKGTDPAWRDIVSAIETLSRRAPAGKGAA
jgi:glycosyltransferase involved in cell wall biosynthesis